MQASMVSSVGSLDDHRQTGRLARGLAARVLGDVFPKAPFIVSRGVTRLAIS